MWVSAGTVKCIGMKWPLGGFWVPLLSSVKKSPLQYAGPISGFKHKTGVTPMTQHLPDTCLVLLPMGWAGWPCPDTLGPSTGPPCTAAGRLGQQSASGARGKLIPSLLNGSLVSQSLPSGGGGRLEPHSEQCQACCQQPSAQMEAGNKEHVLCPPQALLPFLSCQTWR